MKKRGLGKGLDALLGEVEKNAPLRAGAADDTLPVNQLIAGQFQPRQHFSEEELNQLADSVRQHGVIQPIIVRPLSKGQYEIIAGERRFRAARLAGLRTVPVVVRTLSDKKAQLFSLVENLQRSDLNALEQAQGLAALIKKTDLTHAQAAQYVGMSRAAVSNLIRLLDLSLTVRRQLAQNLIEMGHARALLILPAAQQKLAAQQIISRRLTTRQTETLVKNWGGNNQQSNNRTAATKDNDTARLEKELSTALTMRVDIKHRQDGRGKLTLHYGSLPSLESVIKKLKR